MSRQVTNDNHKSELVLPAEEQHHRRSQEEISYRIGDWYWVPDDDSKPAWLGCIVHVGSNFVRFEGPVDEHSSHSERVHFRDMHECRREPEAERIIAEKVAEQRRIIGEAMRQIQSLTSRLAIGTSSSSGETQALSVYRGGSMDEYKQELLAAKDKALPDLFNVIKEAGSVMRTWLSAEMLPMEGSSKQLESKIDLIKNRIFGVELYAGLVESVEEIKSGTPAQPDEPIYLFQRRCYMDEECLASYEAGGMTFKQLPDFEAWLTKTDNLARIIPHQRSVVAFRVRRNKKEEEIDISSLISLAFGGQDENMSTYLYIRNGEQVFRLETKIDFGEKLFPDTERSTLQAGKLYAVMDWGRVKRLGTEGEYLDVIRREAEEAVEREKMPKEDRWRFHSKIEHSSDKWLLWDHKTVYYDDISSHVKDQIDSHNRVVLVLQGLLDRSPVFTPHPPYKLWSPEDFERALKLVYDDSRALTAGDRPNFKAYQAKVNLGLRPGVLAVGQEDYWLTCEAVKYNDYLDRQDHRNGHYLHRKKYRPPDDPGPGAVATVTSCSRVKGCTFAWEKTKTRWDRWGEKETVRTIPRRLTVPADELLCVATYKPGDFHIFYDDPRTRAEYLRWAPLLLRAEEWHQQHSAKARKQ